jgi:hypothetical protein
MADLLANWKNSERRQGKTRNLHDRFRAGPRTYSLQPRLNVAKSGKAPDLAPYRRLLEAMPSGEGALYPGHDTAPTQALVNPLCGILRRPRGRGGLMVQHAVAGASIACSIFLLLLLLGLLHDLIGAYSARRRFARLRALRHFWLRGKP